MEILQSDATLNIFGTAVFGYSNVYLIQRVDPCLEDPVNVLAQIAAGGTTLTLTADGYYQIHKFTMSTTPTGSNWYISGNYAINPNMTSILSGDALYDLLEIDPDDYAGLGIAYEYVDHFSYYFIETYYINLIRSKLLQKICDNTCVPVSDKVTIDTLLMGIEVIKILIEQAQYDEAARIVNLLSTCTGVTTTSCNCT